MASRGGPIAAGTDGSDFLHRQTVASQYKLSARNKSRLKVAAFFHVILIVAMLCKLSADILDRLDIFILEIEELYIPKPLFWEYAWLVSFSVTCLGLSAAQRNRVRPMKMFRIAILVLGLGPILFAMGYYFNDVWAYIRHGERQKIQIWMGYPYALLWYIFLIAALQLHSLQLYFSGQLLQAWCSRGVVRSGKPVTTTAGFATYPNHVDAQSNHVKVD
ncbi:unnamed protein product [Cyprideis torosa]|uniref:Uncharacterized protein n=1 Tax=Cyprideis torosa TaxID=163714 RepID=A0A7R8ZKM8_9CRUS|nr:unnamed protein product [Cyprideis torosa]CAG0891393.1 unnamed protein product [Cyprideis torosa]